MKWRKLLAIFVFTLALTACAGQKQEEAPQKSAETKEKQASSPYPFTEFDVDVDLKNQQDYEIDVSYERESNHTEAHYTDDKQNIHLTGEDALEALDEKFRGFSFDETTSDAKVLKEIERAFNIPDNAQSVEVEIQYNDGQERELRR
ncbi:YusW family protein [Bacillus xiapuensis]|uniref:YusW family protein n=1 Tax=Bacillus xiapuensis TaxID=2014075 RepID=UPI0012FE1C7C|nr:YusW family protein [Bacillus xiapuensis]